MSHVEISGAISFCYFPLVNHIRLIFPVKYYRQLGLFDHDHVMNSIATCLLLKLEYCVNSQTVVEVSATHWQRNWDAYFQVRISPGLWNRHGKWDLCMKVPGVGYVVMGVLFCAIFSKTCMYNPWFCCCPWGFVLSLLRTSTQHLRNQKLELANYIKFLFKVAIPHYISLVISDILLLVTGY